MNHCLSRVAKQLTHATFANVGFTRVARKFARVAANLFVGFCCVSSANALGAGIVSRPRSIANRARKQPAKMRTQIKVVLEN